jgi:hypothetical protein
MGPKWAFVRKKGWRSPDPVVCSCFFIITLTTEAVKVSLKHELRPERVFLAIFFFSLPIKLAAFLKLIRANKSTKTKGEEV